MAGGVFRLHAAKAQQKAMSGCWKLGARKRHLAVLALSVTVVFLHDLARDECFVQHCFSLLLHVQLHKLESVVLLDTLLSSGVSRGEYFGVNTPPR